MSAATVTELLNRWSVGDRVGLGSKVRITAGGVTQYREINPYGSYLSTSDMRLYVGLGRNTVAQRLEIEWPRGKKQAVPPATLTTS